MRREDCRNVQKRLMHIFTTLMVVFALAHFSAAVARAETVGVIMTHGMYYYEKIHASLIENLQKKGYAERLSFIRQTPYPDPIALSNASRKLLVADLDLIITYGAPATVAMLRERPRIPLLYAGVYEPVAKKIKGKKVSGVCEKFNVSSLLRYLKGSLTINRLGVLYTSIEEDSDVQFDEIKVISKKYGFALKGIDVRKSGNLPGVITDVQVDAFIITASAVVNNALPSVLRVAANKRVPTASLLAHEYLSPMITLVSDPAEQGRLLAKQIIRVLDGKPFKKTCSRKNELIYNVMESKRMGLKMSMDLVTEATTLINK